MVSAEKGGLGENSCIRNGKQKGQEVTEQRKPGPFCRCVGITFHCKVSQRLNNLDFRLPGKLSLQCTDFHGICSPTTLTLWGQPLGLSAVST